MVKLRTRSISRETIFILFFIFFIGLLYRIVNLGTNLPGLYNDELYFLLSAYSQVHNIGYLTVSNQAFLGIVYNIMNLYIPSILLFHANPFSARFPIGFGVIQTNHSPVFHYTGGLCNTLQQTQTIKFFKPIKPMWPYYIFCHFS